MDNAAFVQQLCAGTLDEGLARIQALKQEQIECSTLGNALADEALARLYTPFFSLKLAELLTFLGKHTTHLATQALGLKARGDALAQAKLYQAALESLDAAGEVFLTLQDEENWARTRISWVVAATSLGRTEEALREAEKAREIFQRLRLPYWVCVIDHNTAWAYRQVGRYQEAHILYERILSIYPTIEDRSDIFIERSIAMAKGSMAINLSWQGQFEQAHRLQQEALVSYRALGEMDMVVNAEMTLADFDYSQGYYGTAIQGYYRAQDLLAQYQIKSPKMEAYLKLQIAHILVKLNRPEEAHELAYAAVELYREMDVSLDAMNAQCDYATALAASGHLKEALLALDEAEALFLRGGLQHHTLATRLQRAELLLRMGQFSAAYQISQALESSFEQLGLAARLVRTNLLRIEALLGQVEEHTQNNPQREVLLQEALLYGKRAALQSRRAHLQEEMYRSQFLIGQIFALQGNSPKALLHYQAAIRQIERILEDLQYDLSPSFLRTAWTVYAETIILCLQQGKSSSAFHYLERARSMALRQYLHRSHTTPDEQGEPYEEEALQERQEKQAAQLRMQAQLQTWQERHRNYSVLLGQLDPSVSPTQARETFQSELKRCETKINECFERLYLLTATSRPSTRKNAQKQHTLHQIDALQIQHQLAPGQTMLAYFLHKKQLVVFVLTAERLLTYEHADGMTQLRRMLPFLHAHLQPGGWPDPSKPPLPAVLQMLRKLYALLIEPVEKHLPASLGELLIVPYGNLHTLPFHALYNGQQFLVERFQISYLPSSSLLLQAERPAVPTTLAKNLQPLILGYSGKGQLHYALEEAKTLADLFQTRCYLEEEATIALLNKLASGTALIHLATHGLNRLDSPNFSSVVLADGRFSAIDAFHLNLQNCELVTLSGCETGLALGSGGDEQLGLGRAFLAAGTRTLVMSLWSVEDQSTCQFMQLFYQNLLKGTSKVQALCEAQRTLIRLLSSSGAHPYYWAAFHLIGATGPWNYSLDWDHPA